MSWSKWVRQIHRWVSVAFTVTVIVNIVVMSVGQGIMPPPGVTYSLCSNSPASTCSCCLMPPGGAAGNAPMRESIQLERTQ
jgi:hypothetical protein